MSQEWLEERRRRAYELAQSGWAQKDIAEALGVSKGAVSQWLACVPEGGVEALRHEPPPGANSKLSEAQ